MAAGTVTIPITGGTSELLAAPVAAFLTCHGASNILEGGQKVWNIGTTGETGKTTNLIRDYFYGAIGESIRGRNFGEAVFYASDFLLGDFKAGAANFISKVDKVDDIFKYSDKVFGKIGKVEDAIGGLDSYISIIKGNNHYFSDLKSKGVDFGEYLITGK